MTGSRAVDAAFVADVAARIDRPESPVGSPQVPGGENTVLVVGPPADRWVLRTPSRAATSTASASAMVFSTERWCADAARSVGIRTPRVLGTGTIGGRPWSAQEWIAPGASATDSPVTWAGLGALARRVVEAPLTDAPEALFSRFGRDVAHAWRAHVRWNAEQIVTSERLVVRGVVGADETEWLRDRLAPLEDMAVPFGLAHGDLAPRNTVVDEGGELWLVDWGAATTGPAPFVDTTHLIHAAAERRAAATDALRALLEGFGRDPDAEQTADAVALLQALDLVHWAEDRAPERLDRQVSLARTLVERARPR